MGHPLDIPSDLGLTVSVGSYLLRSRSLSISTKTKFDPKHANIVFFENLGISKFNADSLFTRVFDHGEFEYGHENGLRSLEFRQPHP